MLKKKMLFTAVAMSLFLFIPCSWAVTDIRSSRITQQSQSPKRTFRGQADMLRVTAVVTKIENNILYLEDKKHYNLANVKITDYSKTGKHRADQRKLAEMLFIRNRLKEVILR